MKKVIISTFIALLTISASGYAFATHTQDGLRFYVEENYECAKHAFEKDIGCGKYAVAGFFLGDMYLHGRGVVQDNNMAIYYYQLALNSILPKILRKDLSFGMAMAYQNKVVDLYWSHDANFDENLTQTYIWFKIAQAYGIKSWDSENNEEAQITSALNLYGEMIAKRGGNLAEISKKAQTIKDQIDRKSEVFDKSN